MLLSRGIRTASDHRARPTEMRSVLRKLQPIAARTKATRARISRRVLKLMAGYSALPALDLSRRTVTQRAGRHQPGEDVEGQPPGLHGGVAGHQLPSLFDGRPEDRQPAPRLVRLALEWTVGQRVACLAHARVEGEVTGLQLVQLLGRELRRVWRPAQKHNRVSV